MRRNVRARISLAMMVVLVTSWSIQVRAEEEAPTRTLITNVRIFDGVSDRLTSGSVLVEDNLIQQVGTNISAPGATVIDGGGRTLMPGLVDMHSHLCLQET